jgi:hypothetical protein
MTSNRFESRHVIDLLNAIEKVVSEEAEKLHLLNQLDRARVMDAQARELHRCVEKLKEIADHARFGHARS